MIKYRRLPEDILKNIEDAKGILMEEENVIFAYLFGGMPPEEIL